MGYVALVVIGWGVLMLIIWGTTALSIIARNSTHIAISLEAIHRELKRHR